MKKDKIVLEREALVMIEQQNKLIDALYEKSVISHSRKHSEIIERTLDSKIIVIVDFENYQAIPTDLLHKEYIYYLFCGYYTTKPAQEYKDMLEGYDINIVETKSVGTNFVDNRISMYIGYMFGKYNPRLIILVSNDIDYYEMVRDLKAHGYPIIFREISISSKELLRRQTDYLFDKPMTKPIAVKKEPVKDDMSVMMEKLVELNNGNNIIGASKIRFYLRSNLELSESEVKETVNIIKSQCELTEVKGAEEFYKLEGENL